MPERIKSVLPDVKLIFILRDPVQRTVSHYWHKIRYYRESSPFDEVIRRGPSERIIQCSMYMTGVKHFLRYFPIERMYFITTEQLEADFKGVMAGVFKFLEVDPSFSVKFEGRQNPAQIPRNMHLGRVMRGILQRRTKRPEVHLIPRKSLILRIPSRLDEYCNIRPFTPPAITDEQAALLYKLFLPEMCELERIIGRRLEEWGQPD